MRLLSQLLPSYVPREALEGIRNPRRSNRKSGTEFYFVARDGIATGVCQDLENDVFQATPRSLEEPHYFHRK